MELVKNSNRVTAVAGRWYAGDVAYVEAFNYSSQGRGTDSTLILTTLLQRRDQCKSGWPSPDLPVYRVQMKFTGVSKFHIKDKGRLPMQVMGFDITDIADRGWEGATIQVEDYENGRIGFICDSAEITEAAQLPANQ